MSFILRAPVPTLTTTSVLPDPKFDDSKAGRQSVEIKHAMDGSKRSYVKSSTRKKLNFTFLLSREKSLELEAFVQAYNRAQVQITTHRGEVWIGYFVSNPFEFSADARAGGWPGGEAVSITLTFEGTLQTAVGAGTC